MTQRPAFLASLLLCLGAPWALSLALQGPSAWAAPSAVGRPTARPTAGPKLRLSEAQWRARLTPEQFRVLRQKGTECARTGAFWDQHAPGRYFCAGCDQLLFSSESKFDSGTGWPSFFRPASPGAILEHEDLSFGMRRVEITCSRCEGHLGHVFEDGPPPTGLRYCTNSAAFRFEPLRSTSPRP